MRVANSFLRVVSAVLSFLAFSKEALLKAEGESPHMNRPQEIHATRGEIMAPTPTPAPSPKTVEPGADDKKNKEEKR